jgi:hypothetical protein
MFIDDDDEYEEGFLLESSYIVWEREGIGTLFFTEKEAVKRWKKLTKGMTNDEITESDIDIQSLDQTQTNVFLFECETATIQ